MPAGKYQASATKQATNTDMVFFGGTTGPGVDTTTSTTFELSAPTSFSKLNEGQIWYNTTGNALKYTAIAAGTWATGGVLNTGRSDGASAGTQAAGLFFTGEPPGTKSNANESYNGATWTEEADVLVARYYAGGTGTQTAAMCIGGQANPGDITNVETWNGTSWKKVIIFFLVSMVAEE